jgi:perosamine synthetase
VEVPFFKPSLDEETLKSVSEVLRSGWLTTGRRTAEFESRFAEYVGASHAVMANSGTAALHLSLCCIDLRPDEEVILPTMTFAATAEVVEYFCAKPVLVDCREDNLNIDEKLIEGKITARTRAIMPVHYGGHPCEMDAIMAIAKKHGLKVIEDAAHCTPASYRGVSVGRIGHFTCFSFYANKCITTGEGGMVTLEDAGKAERIRRLRLHGLSNSAQDRYNAGGAWRYDIVEKGYKYNPTDFSAAMGLVQLSKANEFLRERRRVVDKYRQLLQDTPEIQLFREASHVCSSWHLFPIRLEDALQKRRDDIMSRLHAKGIVTSVHFVPLHMHSYYRDKYSYRPEDFPVASKAQAGLISLPIYPGLSNQEVEFVAENLKKCLNEV